MSFYVMTCYGGGPHEKWFKSAWAKSGKKLDMGKACVRFRKLEDVPLEVIGEAIRRMPVKDYIAFYEEARAMNWHHTKAAKATKAKTAKPAKAGARRPAAKAATAKAR
jgi:hypothetical protein